MERNVEYLHVVAFSLHIGTYSPLYNTLTNGPVTELLYNSNIILDANSTYLNNNYDIHL